MKHLKEIRSYKGRKGIKKLRERYKAFLETVDVRGKSFVFKKKTKEQILNDIAKIEQKIAKNRTLINTKTPYGPIGAYLRDKERYLHIALEDCYQRLDKLKVKIRY